MTDSSSLVHDLRRLEAEALAAIAAAGAPAALEVVRVEYLGRQDG